MQPLNRSAHAPVGAAFFLFLGLVILPVSLGVAGVRVSFSPRLSAAMDAWQQIAEVFGASYQPATASDLSVVNDSESDPSNPIDSSTSPLTEFACAREPEALAATLPEALAATLPEALAATLPEALAATLPEPLAASLNDVRDPRALKACARRASPKVESRHSLATKRVASAVVTSFENHARAIGVLGAMKVETLTREELLKSIEKQVLKPSFEGIAEIRNLPIPISKSMRVLVRMKRAAAASSAKTAECKVFSALASARRHECERAMLTSMPGTSPDNSEF
jgi:hypothetical protein